MSNHSVLRKFMKYVSLNIIGMIGLSCYILADTFFVSSALGSNGIASLNFAISVYCVINGFGLMLGIGGATKYSILKSKNEDENANLIFSNTISIGIIVGIIMIIIGIFFTIPISKLLGASGDILVMTSNYLKTILCFSPFFILNNIILAFVRNDKNPRLSMIAMLIGSFSNIILDYIFMFPLSMGMFGASFATSLAPIISLSILSIHFIKQKNNFKFIKFKINIFNTLNILGLGLASFITEISSSVVLILFNLVILDISGVVGVAAYGIIANIALVVTSIFTGIAQGIQPLLSDGYGNNNIKLIKAILKYSICLSIILAIFIYIVVFVFSDNIISIFNNENNIDLVYIAKNGLRLYFIGFLFVGLNIIISMFLSSTEKMNSAFIVSITRGLIAIIPCLFVLKTFFGIDGVWLSFVLSEIITAIVSILLLLKFLLVHNTNIIAL